MATRMADRTGTPAFSNIRTSEVPLRGAGWEDLMCTARCLTTSGLKCRNRRVQRRFISKYFILWLKRQAKSARVKRQLFSKYVILWLKRLAVFPLMTYKSLHTQGFWDHQSFKALASWAAVGYHENCYNVRRVVVLERPLSWHKYHLL